MSNAWPISAGEAHEDNYARELARVLCRSASEWIAMLHAHCDESYDGDARRTKLYVVAGFVAGATNWSEFETFWRRTMRELGISRIGCHAAKCEYGGGDYRDMAYGKRREIQHRLIVDIAASRLFSVVAVMDMAAYRPHRERISKFLAKHERQFNEPHVLAVRQCVQQMCQITEDATREPIAFVFDRNAVFGKRARQWYDMDIGDRKVNFYDRLGPFTEDDRMRAVGLQAADMLAYAAFRHFSGRNSWQWDELNFAGQIFHMTTGAAFWEHVSELMDRNAAAKG